MTQQDSSNFNTAMVHLYRAEITRANSWRSRLDVTTNWALLSTAAAISFAFGQQNTHHSVIILDTLLITLFLFLEARRYRYYELWSYRIRLMETDFYAALLVPPYKPDPDWTSKLTESLLNPQFTISGWEAFGRRLRLNYLWIYLALLIVWLAKLLLYPDAIGSLDVLIARARIGVAPGWLVMTLVVSFYAGLVVIALVTRRLRKAVGEVFPRYGDSKAVKTQPTLVVDPQMQVSADPAKAYPFLAIITAHQLDAITARIQAQFKREATHLDPDNTSGTQESLILPVTVTEIAALKALVKEADTEGTVVVIPANELFVQSATIQKAAEATGEPP